MSPSSGEQITIFAKTNFRNQEVPFGIKPDDRRRHMYLIGKTGMGKTTMMENMVIQDIRNGHGVAFLDPHGDSIQRILNSVPSSRVNDVIYFNPADMEFPLAFNILEAVDSKYKHLVASGLMGVFTKIWANLWSARMEYILNNTILALLDSPGNTLLGIPRMYVDKKYRKRIVDNVKDPIVRSFWVDEFANYNEKYRTEAIAPIQNKVGQFLSSSIIRNIVGQPKSTIDLREVMDKQKILIMDLSKGKVGEDNSALLGAMLVTKLQLAAMSRTDIPEHERRDFYLYVDEFQNFATDSFATILSEARKYRLNLIVGHQYMGQLVQERNTKVKDAILGNVGTLVVFRIGAEDAELLIKEFEPIFEAIDMVNLPKYNIVLKLMINGVASEPFSAVTLPPSPEYFTGNAEKVIKVSRERYANPVLEVEEKISRWMGAEFHQESAALHIGDAGEPAEEPFKPEIPAPMEPERKQLPVIQQESVPFMRNEEPVQTEPGVPVKAENLNPGPIVQKQEPAPAQARPVHIETQPSAKPAPKAPLSHVSQENRPSSNNNNNRQFKNRTPHQNRQHSGQKQQHKSAVPQRKEHPVWETVANLHSSRKNEKDGSLNELVTHLFKPPGQPGKPAQPAPPPQPSGKETERPKNNVSEKPQAPLAPASGQQNTERKVVKPGESHTF